MNVLNFLLLLLLLLLSTYGGSCQLDLDFTSFITQANKLSVLESLL